MFEDIAKKYFVVPHELGMTTTLIVPQTIDPFREEFEQEAVKTPHINYITNDLADFLKLCRSTPNSCLLRGQPGRTPATTPMDGGAGSDRLHGGLGKDVLKGSAGKGHPVVFDTKDPDRPAR